MNKKPNPKKLIAGGIFLLLLSLNAWLLTLLFEGSVAGILLGSVLSLGGIASFVLGIVLFDE